MEKPELELQTRTDDSPEKPEFGALPPTDELARGERTRDDFFDAVLELDSPATAPEVADLAGHGVDAAREYLGWFERMGVVTQVTDSPATYRCNREYLTWRRVQALRDRYTETQLLNALRSETERDEAFAEEFDVPSPDQVAIADHADDSDQSVDGVWECVSDWQTTRRRITLLERALTSDRGDVADRRTVV